MDSKKLIFKLKPEKVQKETIEKDMNTLYEDLTNLNLGSVTYKEEKSTEKSGDFFNQVLQQFIVELPTVLILEGLIQVIGRWMSHKKAYTLTIENENGTSYTINAPDKNDLLEIMTRLTENSNG
jgi:hypothetical protein